MVEIRKVAYHPEKGVYLGRILDQVFWSRENPQGGMAAPTFLTMQEFLDHYSSTKIQPEGVELREVHPSGPANMATSADCNKALLGSW